MLLQVFTNSVFYNSFFFYLASSLIGAHIALLFFPTGVFGDRPNRSRGQDAQLTEVHELSFND
jgi:hypothetical protein